MILTGVGPGGENFVDADTLLFYDSSIISGYTLYRSDGTANGTFPVVEFGNVPSNLDNVPFFQGNVLPGLQEGINGKLFFVATEDQFGAELWVSDGSIEGTGILKDINPVGSSDISNLTNVDGTLFFSNSVFVGDVGQIQTQLWKSDGTEAGTQLVSDVFSFGEITDLTDVNGTLFFRGRTGIEETGLWKSNGTTEGTQLVLSEDDRFFRNLVSVDDTLFFIVATPSAEEELWKSDGTEAGTQLVKSGLDIEPRAEFVDVNGTLFFTADEMVGGVDSSELWKSDGTEAGTQLVKDIRPEERQGGAPVNRGSSPDNLINVNGTLFFTADDGVNGTELWKSDGTEAGTQLVKDISPGESPTSFANFINANDKLYFQINRSSSDEIWESDGTEAGTFQIDPTTASIEGIGLITDFNGDFFRFPDDLTEFNNQVFFDASVSIVNSEGLGQPTSTLLTI